MPTWATAPELHSAIDRLTLAFGSIQVRNGGILGSGYHESIGKAEVQLHLQLMATRL